MYGEYVEVDGRRVFVLCNPDTSKAELERRAREQITREQEQCEQDDGHVYEMVGPPPWSCTFCGYKPDDGQSAQLYVDPDAQVEMLRRTMLDIIDKCIGFAAEVDEAEAETGCMSPVTIQQHLAYLRGKANDLGRRVQ
jgi:hypothetical protein